MSKTTILYHTVVWNVSFGSDINPTLMFQWHYAFFYESRNITNVTVIKRFRYYVWNFGQFHLSLYYSQYVQIILVISE